MERVVVVREFNGILGMNVCAVADATDDEILAVCNLKNPCGTTMGWCRVVRESEGDYDKDALPVPCANDAERVHYAVTC